MSFCLKNIKGTFLARDLRRRGVIIFFSFALSVVLGGCGIKSQITPTSVGEGVSGYTYVPIDPTKVQIDISECQVTYSDFGEDDSKTLRLLDVLPDNAVRMSMESTDARGNVTYGVTKAGSTGAAYKLTADYVNSDTVNKSVWIRKTMIALIIKRSLNPAGNVESIEEKTERKATASEDTYKRTAKSRDKGVGEELRWIEGTERYEVKSFEDDNPSVEKRKSLIEEGFMEYSVPIYVGIGLRIVAEGISMAADANIAGVGVIGAEAEAKRLRGSLTVQTLGINSQAVASALPVHSELSRTTAENAFVAIGSIKSMLRQKDTVKYPRVVGLYLPFHGGRPLVNALISELSRNPVRWCPNGYSIADLPADKPKQAPK